MFSSARADPVRVFPHHQRQASDTALSYALPPRPIVELPRPLEPRPNQHLPPSLSDAASSQRRPEVFRSSSSHQAEYRPQTQSLPRLHDILTSGPPATSPPAYSSAWGPGAAAPPSNRSSGDSYYGRSSWQPPQPKPAPEPIPLHQAQQGRRLDLPILETNPVARHDSHAPVQSPYAGYADSARDYRDGRYEKPRQLSGNSFHANGVPSPYTSAATDEGPYRSPAGPFERPPSSAYPPAGPESSKKYLGIKDVPGEGAYHVYEGGYRIPTHVDGETVNPAWGLTKANKPRKRLAMACLDCREKKIKCEPGPLSCLQCEKAKRPCRKAPTHQSQSEPNTTPLWQNGSGSPVRKTSNHSPPSAREMEPEVMNKRRHVEELSPSSAPSKKHRSASPIHALHSTSAPQPYGLHQQASPTMPMSPGRAFSLDQDPYAVDPDMAIHLVEHYFAHVNNATFCLFPHHHFMRWMMTSREKCQNERLVLYAMLAVGSLFAEERYSGFGRLCARVAADAIQGTIGRFNVAFVQARLLLGLYHSAKGATSLAWDYLASGVHAATYLHFHTEQGCEKPDGVDKPRNEFAFSREQLIECKRRTLWTGFLMDRFSEARQTLISSKDIFLRLPCTEDIYERGFVSSAPFYNNGIVDPAKAVLTASSPISPMAWLVLVAAIWSDVVDFIRGAVHRSSRAYEDMYERSYEETWNALQGWASRLPEHLNFNATNVQHSIRGGYAGIFVSMHVVFHLAWLKMNRFARHEYIPRSVARNIRAANRHAHDLLQLMNVVGMTNRELTETEGPHATFSLTTPSVGTAILAAIDVVGAGGLDTNMKTTLELISCGNDCLRELGRYWDSARQQNKECEKRFYQIHNVLKHPFTARSGCWLGREWGVDSSLEREFAPDNDCIYGVSDRDYFDALKDDSGNGRPPSGSLRIGQ